MKSKSNISLEATPIEDTDVANCKYVNDAIHANNVVNDYTSSVVTSDYVNNMWSSSFMKIGNVVFAGINFTVKNTSSSTVKLGTLPEHIIPVYDQCVNTVTNGGVPCYVYIDSDGEFGIRKMSASSWSIGEGVRINVVYIAKNTESNNAN